MEKKTDTRENAVFEGTVTVVPAENIIKYGAGNIELAGTLYADTIRENTGNIGVDLEETVFNDGYFDKTNISSDSVPDLGKERFYLKEDLFKSKNSSGKVTTYQPTNTKGDITVHSLDTQVRLPIGKQGNVLVVENSKDTNVKWVRASSFDITQKTKCVITGSGKENSAYIIPVYSGSYYIVTFPYNRNGSSAVLFTSKIADDTPYASSTRLSSSPSIISEGNLFLNFTDFSEIELFKNYTESNGEYFIGSNYKNEIDTNFTTTKTTGIYLLTLTSETQTSNSVAIKNDSSSNTFLQIRLTSSLPGPLPISWNSNEPINITDSNVTIIDTFSEIVIVNLAGTDPVKLNLPYYLNKSGFVIIEMEDPVEKSPKAFISFSKSNPNFSMHRVKFELKGELGNTSLTLLWDPDEFLSLKKNTNFYNGNYKLTFPPMF